MAIEKVSDRLIRVNGYLVEVLDTREPDMFDILNGVENAALQTNGPKVPQDSIITLSRTAGLQRFDPVYATYSQLPRFVEQAARAARTKAVSYRDFRVGASACAFDDEGGRVGYFFGANYKPDADSPKYCAELDIVKKVRSSQFNRIIALAVFGPSDFANVDPYPGPTLPPCGVCREMLATDPVFPEDLIIVTANKEGDQELFLKDELLRLHAP